MTRRILYAISVLLALAVPAGAQTFTLNQTTTSAAVGVNDTTVSLTSASAATGSSFGAVAVGQGLFVDAEFMRITAISSTTATVKRDNSMKAPHASGAVVYIGAPAAFQKADPPIGTCTTASQGDPWVNIQNGKVWRCTNSFWANVIDEYVFLPPTACQSSVSGNSTGTNGYTSLGTAPSIPVVQAQTSATGTNTHYFMCNLSQPGRIDKARGSWVVDAQIYYGVQTTSLGTQVATLASGTMNSKTVFTLVDYPAPGASETATGLAEAARADSGTLTITPAVGSFNNGTTTAGEFFSATFTPASPISVSNDRRQLQLTLSLLNTATSATVTNVAGVLVHYRRVNGL